MRSSHSLMFLAWYQGHWPAPGYIPWYVQPVQKKSNFRESLASGVSIISNWWQGLLCTYQVNTIGSYLSDPDSLYLAFHSLVGWKWFKNRSQFTTPLLHIIAWNFLHPSSRCPCKNNIVDVCVGKEYWQLQSVIIQNPVAWENPEQDTWSGVKLWYVDLRKLIFLYEINSLSKIFISLAWKWHVIDQCK